MAQYLYGASVQGIQNFIFETNKLREIAGASQLVDNIFSIRKEKYISEFDKYCQNFGHEVDDNNIIMSAAGNIKYKVDEKICKKIVREFPKHVSNYAPGITISQAVVKLTDNLKSDIDELEKKLKAQRNMADMPIDIGFMGLERARRTGGVGFEYEVKEVQDRGTRKKVKEDTLKLFEVFKGSSVNKQDVAFDLEEITKKSENSWLAIIHADGNGLGNILQNLSKNISSNNEVGKAYKEFSKKLEAATKEAVQEAFNEVISYDDQKKTYGSEEKYPIRPVVLGGDDITIIIRADLAFNFTKVFLNAFEEKTKEHLKSLNKYDVYGLTACAGIAYIKDSYPFHYGVNLAERLVREAKDFSRSINPNLPRSSLLFYKVQSSFTEDLKKMKKRTHFAEKSKMNFDYGPYLLKELENNAHITELEDGLEVLRRKSTDKSKGVSKLRRWVSELFKDKSKADFMMDRIKFVNDKFYKDLNLETERNKKKTIINDLIQLHTFKEMYNEN